ncbi:MAG TPA: Gfo/Idh/MocA family oxidoreductase, partial [Polyangiaceae bacterium]
GAKRAHGTYQALAEDPDIDVIYVATPHPMHRPDSLLCMSAGKAVLCEKPITVNAAECAELIAAARGKPIFLMEGMWTRFLPAIVKLRELLAKGVIGEPRMVTADFGFRGGWDPKSRTLDPSYAGGGLLDVGCYVVALAYMVLGRPTRATGAAHLGETKVDEQAAVVLEHPGGGLSLLSCAVRTNTPWEARIDGTEGRIRVPMFWCADELHLEADGKPVETIRAPREGHGFSYEASEVGRCLRKGLYESEVMPLDESLHIMQTLDELRRQFGLTYPMERSP